MISDIIKIQKGLPIFIWGNGEVGKLVQSKLEQIGIKVNGFISGIKVEEKGEVLNKETLLLKYNKYIVVRGWLGAFYLSDEEIKAQWLGCEDVITISNIYEPMFVEELSKEYYLREKVKFDNVRKTLGDNMSISSFDAFIESKVEYTNLPLLPFVIPTQYFFKDSPWQYKDNEVLVDCGAFNGDSICDFIKLCGEKYSKIIAFEPDSNNFYQLNKWIKETDLKNIITINTGVYEKKMELSFSVSGDMETKVIDKGDVKIQVDSIDNICRNENVSIIKMDIEGSELSALRGAEKTIKEKHPILMISAYHKKEDLFMLQEYINSLYSEYMYFFRCHKPIPIDAVLYAVPKNRLV